MMRIAILADIHGNLPAFEAVLRHVRQQAPDFVFIAGDIVIGAPDSVACWQLAQSLGCPIVRGNHERYLAHIGTAQGDPAWLSEQYKPVQWAATQFTTAERAAVAALPLALSLPYILDLLVVHATARSDRENLPPSKPDADIDAMFPSVQARWIVRGHDHIARTHLWRDKQIITVGSVGLPMDGSTAAQYLLLETTPHGWQTHHQAVDYDLNLTLQRFAATRYVAETGVMGRLFLREVITAAPHFVPFLRLYHQWTAATPLSFSDALERYLTHY
ncbi:MAG: metallophosphoesterase family protein [Caldilineaceae bacterium]|jgi:predicted phosphodiesterase